MDDAPVDEGSASPTARRPAAGAVRDVTRRPRAESTLLESEREFRALAEAMPQIVWATRPDGASIYFNQRWVDYTGMTLEESYGDGWNTPFHPDDRQRAWDAWQHATRQDAPYSLECRLRRADGAYRWWRIRGSPFRDDSGAIVKWFGTCTDIEDIRHTEDALRESEARYGMLFASMLDGFAYCQMLYDEQGRPDDFVYLSVNPAFEKLTGLRDVLGKRVTEVIPAIRDETPELLPTYGAVARTGEPAEFEIEFTPLGLWLHVSASRPEPDHFVAVFHDVTARKLAEFQAARMTRLYATLSQVNQAIVRVKDPTELYQDICDVAVKFGEFALAWVGLLDEESGNVRPVAATGVDIENWPFEVINLRRGVSRDGLVATTIRSQQIAVTEDIKNDARMRRVLGQVEGRDYHSIAVIPISPNGRTIGTVVLVSGRAGLFRDGAELGLLEEMGLDISFALESMATEAERRRIEKRNALMLERMVEGLALHEIILDEHGAPCDYRFLDVNAAFEEMTGLKASDIIGRTVLEVLPNTEPSWIERYGAVAQTGAAVRFEQYARELDRHYGVVAYSPQVGQFVTLVSDITEREQAATALAESEKKHRALFETMSEGIVYEDADGTITSANPAAERLLGLSLDQMQGRTSLDPRWKATHEDGSDWPGETHPIPVALKTGKPTANDVQAVYNPQTGEYVWLSVNATPEFLPGETRPFRAYAVFRDITERKRAEEQLAAQTARLKVLADASREFGESGGDYQGVLDLVVRKVAEQLGDSSQIRLLSEDGETLDLVASHDPDPAALEAERLLWRLEQVRTDGPNPEAIVFRTGESALVPIRSRENSRAMASPEGWAAIGPFVPHSVVIAPLRAHETNLGVMVLARWRTDLPAFTPDDLTLMQDLADRAALAIANARLMREARDELLQRRLAEEDVRALNETLEARVQVRTAALEAANRELEAFSYSVSHDLRAPLRHIDGFGKILLVEHANELNAEGRRLLLRVVANSNQMGVLIDDLLAFSRVTRKELGHRPVDMEQLVRSVCEDLGAGRSDRAIAFDIGDLCAVPGDQALLRQVWANLIGNAVKFTRPVERPRIEVRCEDNAGMCRFTVRDNGVGFDAKYAVKLFQPFQRLHHATEFEGTGIGLAIVARIVERHGGHVWAEGAPDAGATFGFSLPLETEEK
jgi:PAS domain S-box-containing protein